MIDPGELARDYTHFRVSERLLFTGHSHQAWPDVGLKAQEEAWLDAAQYVDEKWERAFARAEEVRSGFRRLLGDSTGFMALGSNTHELVVRLLSGLDLRRRPRIVTTDGEFHTLRRQLDRLAEEGVEVLKVDSADPSTLAPRIAALIDDRTAAVMVSSVLFKTARIVPGLAEVASAAEQAGAVCLVDAYHHLGVVPFSLDEMGLGSAYVVGGGYKYCQLGEGNCFLRFPADCVLRPVITGWYSEFDALHGEHDGVAYGRGDARFAGATYDPTSHYRAAAVFGFFESRGLDVPTLREISQRQMGVLVDQFDQLGLDPAVIDRDRHVQLTEVAGFLSLRSPHARELSVALRSRGVLTDSRETSLRFGPAPYTTDDQIAQAMNHLGDLARGLSGFAV